MFKVFLNILKILENKYILNMKTINTFINERGNFYDHMTKTTNGNIKPVDDIISSFDSVIRAILSKSKTACVIVLSSGATNDNKAKSLLQDFIDIANQNKLDIYNAAEPDIFKQIQSVEELACRGGHIDLNTVFELFDNNTDEKNYNYCLLVYDGFNHGNIPAEYRKGVIAFSIYHEGYKTVNVLDFDNDNIKFKNSICSYYFPKK